VLVSTEWLEQHLGERDLAVVDMRWREDGSARSLYDASHVPGAVHLDWSTDLVDPANPVAFMLAPPDLFEAAMARCGIGEETTVVAYADQYGNGPYRLWWASRMYGHESVSVLDGGFDKWSSEGRPTLSESSQPLPPARPWRALAHPVRPTSRLIAHAEDVASAELEPDVVVLDSRPAEQYKGEAVWFEAGPVQAGPDGIAHTPRGDLRAGHIPWAASMPAAELYEVDFTMKSPAELRDMFARVGATPERRAITYCGCGISASALLFALTLSGVEDAALYDASWEEWGRDPSRPIARA
jgi:thiosulfate/3-mercaptopyruvate sulfurtransferase